VDKKTLNESLKVQVDVLWWVEIGSSCGIHVSLGASFSFFNEAFLCIFCRIFGVSAEGEMEAERFKKVIEKTLSTISASNVVGDFVPWLKWIFHASGYVAHMKKVKADLDSFLQELLDLKKGTAGNIAQDSGERQEDFVDVLLGQKSETGNEPLSDESIRGVIQVIYVSHLHETSDKIRYLSSTDHCRINSEARLEVQISALSGSMWMIYMS
jgi:hypothetical protein